jgi:hypothetical protein
MKNLRLKYIFVLVISLTIFSGCNDDDEDKVSAYIGNFSISKAMLAETLTIPIVPFNVMSSVTAPIGQDITQAIQNALLSQVTCSSANKSWIELRNDNSMYMSCEGTNALNAGT